MRTGFGLVLLFAAGCFPYREAYRPALDGVVVDDDDRPASGIPVVTCSESSWLGLRQPKGCPRKGQTRTAADGRFSLPRLTEWEWCCLGEAPLPITAIAACGADGSIGAVVVQGQGPARVQLVPFPIFRASYHRTGLRGAPDADFFVALCNQVAVPPGAQTLAPSAGKADRQ